MLWLGAGWLWQAGEECVDAITDAIPNSDTHLNEKPTTWIATIIRPIHALNGAVLCLLTLFFIILKCCGCVCQEDIDYEFCIGCNWLYTILAYIDGILTSCFAVLVQFGFWKDNPNFCNSAYFISDYVLDLGYGSILVMLLLVIPCIACARACCC